MARSAALGLTLGGVGAIAIISGIQGKSIGQVLKGELGPPPNPAFSGNPGETNSGEVNQSLNKIGEFFGEAAGSKAGPATELARSGLNAPSPASAGKNAIQPHPTRIEEVVYGIHVALEYKSKLDEEVKNKRVTKPHAEQLFHSKFPYYEDWTKELSEYNKNHFIS